MKSFLTINLDAVTENVRRIRTRANAKGIIGVLKANAYGHGATVIAHHLKSIGVERLAVATLREGVHLRAAGIDGPIHLLGEMPVEDAKDVLKHHLTPSVCSLPSVHALAKAAGIREAKHTVRSGHAEKFKKLLDQTFDLADRDKNGALTRRELRHAVEHVGLAGHSEVLSKGLRYFAEFDEDHNGSIDKDEWMKRMGEILDEAHTEASSPHGAVGHSLANPKVNVNIDTGMSRVGLDFEPAGVRDFVQNAENCGVEVEGFFTHFHSAWDGISETQEQLDRFLSATQPFAGSKTRHVSNTPATLRGVGVELDFVRVGGLLYGQPPDDSTEGEASFAKQGWQPALSWTARPTYVKFLPGGRTVGYGGTYKVPEGGQTIATFNVGFADGLPRPLGGGVGKVLMVETGELCPLVGKIAMDQVMAVVPDETTEYSEFQIVQDKLQCSHTSQSAFARALQTCNSDFSTRLAKRLTRVYKRDGKLHVATDKGHLVAISDNQVWSLDAFSALHEGDAGSGEAGEAADASQEQRLARMERKLDSMSDALTATLAALAKHTAPPPDAGADPEPRAKRSRK